MFTKLNATTLTADEDLFLAADGATVVRAGDYRAASLLARAGGDIHPKQVERLNLNDTSVVQALVKTGPTPEQTSAAKAEYDKHVATAAVASRKNDAAGALSAYEAAAKVANLEPSHSADARAQAKALKAQIDGDKAQHVLGKTATVSPEAVAGRSTRPASPTDVR